MSDKIPELDAFEKPHAAIGNVASTWAFFEFLLDDLIWFLALVHHSEYGMCITAQLNGVAPRFRAIAALAHLRGAPQEIINSINSFSQEAEKIGRRRHRQAHDPVLMFQDSKQIMQLQITADRKLVNKFAPFDLDSVLKTADDISGLIKALMKLKADILAKIDTSLNKRLEAEWAKAYQDQIPPPSARANDKK
jgi:hypothetical protein